MNGHELLRRLRKTGRANGMSVTFDAAPGKGSHGRIYYGPRFTTMKDRRKEIGPGLLQKMLSDLGLTKDELS